MAVCVNTAGVRGAFAVRDAQQGDLLARVLARDSVELADFEDFTAAVGSCCNL